MHRSLVAGVATCWLTITALTVLLSACQPELPTAGGGGGEERPPLRFSHGYWLGFFPLSIAEEKGFFAEQGVDVELVFNPDLYGMISDFAAGKVDGLPWTMEAVVRVLAKEPDARVVLPLGQTAGADVIMARPEITRVSDLKGKKIAAKSGALGEMLVGEMLEKHGLALDEVTLVDASETDVIKHLTDGTIQAAHTWEPYATQAQRAGARAIFSSKETPGLFADFTVFRGAVLRDRPDDVRAFVRAWFQAVEYWKTHPEEGDQVIARALKIPVEDISTEGHEFFSLEEVQRNFAPGNDPTSLAPLVSKHVEFLVQDGQLGRRPELHQMFDSSFLPRAANPE
ncbi:ABC transporter substrate-binding protein [Sorangium sp. So ce1036]|uniref:ABC transporter substrate-binding protein n=1 Tax=Sorangium sp. So ce1036 TaxID=3133328 RepID=UPI003EFDEA82